MDHSLTRRGGPSSGSLRTPRGATRWVMDHDNSPSRAETSISPHFTPHPSARLSVQLAGRMKRSASCTKGRPSLPDRQICFFFEGRFLPEKDVRGHCRPSSTFFSIHFPAVTPLSFSLPHCRNLPAFHFSFLRRLMSPGRTCPTASLSTCGASGKETGSERGRCRGKIASNGAAFFNLNLVFSSLLLLSTTYGLIFFVCVVDLFV